MAEKSTNLEDVVPESIVKDTENKVDETLSVLHDDASNGNPSENKIFSIKYYNITQTLHASCSK